MENDTIKMKTYWISFSDGKCIGCCIVDAESEAAAIIKTWLLGINPGGDAVLIEMPDVEEAHTEIARWGKDIFIPAERLNIPGYRKEFI